MWLKLGVIAAAFAAGWIGNGWRLDAQIEERRAELAEQAVAFGTHVREEENRLRRLAEANDEKQSEELKNALSEIDDLRRRVSANPSVLRVAAQCPKRPAVVPPSDSSPGVDDAAGPRLTDAAQRDYFVLRERIALAGKMIEGLQTHIREQCSVAD